MSGSTAADRCPPRFPWASPGPQRPLRGDLLAADEGVEDHPARSQGAVRADAEGPEPAVEGDHGALPDDARSHEVGPELDGSPGVDAERQAIGRRLGGNEVVEATPIAVRDDARLDADVEPAEARHGRHAVGP